MRIETTNYDNCIYDILDMTESQETPLRTIKSLKKLSISDKSYSTSNPTEIKIALESKYPFKPKTSTSKLLKVSQI